MHAGQAPARAADPAVRHGEHRMRKHRRVAAVAAILGVAIQRIQIADAVAEVADRVFAGVLQVGSLGPQLHADHVLGRLDRLGRNLALCRGVADVFFSGGGGHGQLVLVRSAPDMRERGPSFNT